MDPLKYFLTKLDNIISLENSESIETLGGYIVGELLGDYEGRYGNLYEGNARVQKIGDLASDIEISNGTPDQLRKMWDDIKILANELKNDT